MPSVSEKIKTFVIPYVTLLEEVRDEIRTYCPDDSIPPYFRGPAVGFQPEHLKEIKSMPVLPLSLSLTKDRSQVPPRAFYGFRLALADAVRILKKIGYLEYAPIPTGVSDKEAYLEAHITTLFPDFVDHYINVLHKDLGVSPDGIIPTFFADVIGDDRKVITILTITDSWSPKPFLSSPIIARLAYFLEKDVKEEDLPSFYLAAYGDGLWMKPSDPYFKKRIREVGRGERPVAVGL